MILNRQRTVRIAQPALESFLRRMSHHLRLGNAEVTIAFVTDAEIARLNHAYRKKKGPTDVLSFPAITHRKPVRPPVAQPLLAVPTSTNASRKHVATKLPASLAAALRGGRLSPPTAKNCHPDRSDPAFSCTRGLRAGSRSGGTVAKSQQAQSAESAASSLLARLSLRPQQPLFLGDIAISPATARRNAKSSRHSLTTELRILMLHGTLHLLGYDHETDNGQMHRFEQKLRRQLRLS